MMRAFLLACSASLLAAACSDAPDGAEDANPATETQVEDAAPAPEPVEDVAEAAPAPGAEPNGADSALSDEIAAMLPLRGFGHEPNWHVRVEAETTTIYRQTDPLVSFPTRQPETAGARLQFSDPDGAGQAVFARETCRDIATGMPHPYTVTADTGTETFQGCGGDPETLFAGANWTLAMLGGDALASDRELSIRFEDGRVSGSSGCNRFMGGYTLTGESLTLTQMASTQMACPDDAMTQEMRILERLSQVSMFDLTDEGALVLRTGPGETITAYRTE